MSFTAISAKGLGKRYAIGAAKHRYLTFRETLVNAFSSSMRRLKPRSQSAGLRSADFWALQDVSFDIQPGETVGVIGRNGAGKSTLLKIISQITEPTQGEVHVRGRVGTLLEIGTGFHPELTGNENVYLYGAILGMRRAEIARKFDEIVAFAEMEKFIETPVKRYSSGMYMRLAFAVAAHLETEILLVDEVLAVGDARFQQRCLGKMEDVSNQGRTVVFVSHNMAAITRLCRRAIWLNDGKLVMDGSAIEVGSQYLNADVGGIAERVWLPGNAPSNTIVRLCAARVITEAGKVSPEMDVRFKIGVEIEYEILEAGHSVVPNYHFYGADGTHLFMALDDKWMQKPRAVGRYRSTGWIPGNILTEGLVTVGVGMMQAEPFMVQFHAVDAVAFYMVDNLKPGSARGGYAGKMPGVIRPKLTWDTRLLEKDE